MPTTTGVATSFIDFTRASNATVTDSDGKVKWAPHNLLTNSESFGASTWNVTSGATVTANSTSAPNSTTTADTIAFTTAGYHYQPVSIGSAITNTTYTVGMWLWSTTGKAQIVLRMHGQTTGADQTLQTITLTSTPTLFTISRTFTSTDTAFNVGLDNRTVAGGDGIAGNVIAWGASLYRSDLGGMQPNTSAYPMYNPTTPKNLLGFTEDWTNAAWTKSNLAATPVIANAILAPNGLQTADKIVENTSAALHQIYQAYSGAVASGTYTFSVYLKAGERSTAKVAVSDFATGEVSTNIDLVAGTASAAAANGNWTSGTSSITPLSDGWYRIRLTAVKNSSGSSSAIPLVQIGTASYTGDGTSGIYLWGAQLSDSASLDPYVPVYGAAITSAAYYGPRRDFDGATLACKGLLVEEQRVNLQLNSNVFGTSTFAATVVAGAAASPSGLIDASSLACTSTSGRAILSTSVTSGVVYTFSVFIKAGTNTSAYIELAGTAGSGGQVVFNLSSGTVTSGTGGAIVPAPNGFYRCSVTSTATGTGASDMRIGTGDATSKTVFVYGAQLEANATFATSYIPTGAATATRNADVASVSTQAFPYSATEGTLVVAWQLAQLSGSPAAIHLTDAAESNRIRINAHLSGINRSTITAAGALVDNIDTSTAATGITKYAIGGKSADYAVYRNGSAGGTSTNAGFPSGCTEMRIGRDAATGNFNGHIRQITYIPRRLANAELQTRTV